MGAPNAPARVPNVFTVPYKMSANLGVISRQLGTIAANEKAVIPKAQNISKVAISGEVASRIKIIMTAPPIKPKPTISLRVSVSEIPFLIMLSPTQPPTFNIKNMDIQGNREYIPAPEIFKPCTSAK